MAAHERVLDRLVPPDFEHVQRFALAALAPSERPKGIPVAAGINWYREFDNPVKDADGRWWIAKDGVLTSVRGGHCICIKADEPDPISWWQFYNQGKEGACVGFGSARMKSLLDRCRYDAFELYHYTQILGGYPGIEGAYVRDAMAVLQQRGAIRFNKVLPDPASKISAYRWATTTQEVLQVLDLPISYRLGAVPILNSWGQHDYPHITWMTGEVLQRLINEDGEVAIVTDL